jgi:hypothetical protein
LFESSVGSFDPIHKSEETVGGGELYFTHNANIADPDNIELEVN